MLTYGAANAFNVATPPNCSAGKNLTTSNPRLTACATSEGVIHPGNTKIFFDKQCPDDQVAVVIVFLLALCGVINLRISGYDVKIAVFIGDL